MNAVFVGRNWHKLHFAEILREQGARDSVAAENFFEEIVGHYNQPHRGHHNNRHIAEMHALFDLYGAAGADREAAFVAAELHDVVYRPFTGAVLQETNEAQSMEFARLRLSQLGIAEEFIARVVRVIQSTSPGEECRDELELLFHDCDYWVLGSTPERYRQYMRGIAKEYCAESNPQLYSAGRGAFLAGLLQQQRIFHTPSFHVSYGAQALSNISWELGFLEREDAAIGSR